MRIMVRVNLAFGLFSKGERLLVSEAFLERYGRYLTAYDVQEYRVVEDDFSESDEPVEDVVAAFDAGEKGLTDGPSDHLPSEG